MDCCTFVDGVGAVPPEFLRSYTFQGTNQSAPDMYGYDASCDYWTGPDGFKYWTTSHADEKYTWGHDIVFQDGPTGVTWRWGVFNVTAQPDELFALPNNTTCTQTCSKVLSTGHHDALAPHVRTARLGVGLGGTR